MNDQQWQAVWELFEAASKIEPGQRQRFVNSASADGTVVEQVLVMLHGLDAETRSCAGSLAGAAPAPSPEADAWPEVGQNVGSYVVTGPLGRGGMGEVYSGRDSVLGRNVALKFLKCGDVGSDPEGRSPGQARFIREAQAASALNHPNIVTVHEVIRSEDTFAIVTELVEGRSLRELCGTPLPPAQVVDIGVQIAKALAAAHANGIVHRDIKPENIMLRPDGYVKVLDFGLARQMAGNVTSTAGLPVGTLRYMSPEHARGEAATPASDVFSLGIGLYELATGVHPFEAGALFETVHRIVSCQPSHPTKVNPNIPAYLASLILAMLDKDPARRPTAAQLVRSLADSEPGLHTMRASPRTSTRKRRIWLYATVTLAAVPVLFLITMQMIASRATAPVEGLRGVPLPGLGGYESYPAFSPDGKQIAFARDEEGEKHGIYVKLIGPGPPLRLTPKQDDDVDPVWSPDGMQIALLRRAADHLDLMVMAALGGAERPVARIENIMSEERLLAWQPGHQVLVATDGATPATLWLSAFPLDGTSRKN
jgi:hypothetical protein